MTAALIISDDLIDSSRISGHGRELGITFRQCRDMIAVEKGLELQPIAIFIDLHVQGLDLSQLVEKAKQLSRMPKLIAFGSHVDAARLKSARIAGCDEVLPRSSFFERLPVEIAKWVNESNSEID